MSGISAAWRRRAPYSAGMRTFMLLGLLLGAGAVTAQSASVRVLAWNDLGMHCMDPDFSVFAILPPYNTVNAQVIRNGRLETTGALRVTYEGVRDPNGSINTTSIGKTNFWQHVSALYGASPPPDTGLAGNAMPGASNTPQPMGFDTMWSWFHADGIPMTPIDDAQQKNPYPHMRIAVRDANNTLLASTATTVPVSQELDCKLCHASGASPWARPPSGWVFEANAERDNRLNILKLHDARNRGKPAYTAALQAVGYHPNGLYDTVVTNGKPVMCMNCHISNALPGFGIAGIKPLTEAIHGKHATVVDPSGATLDSVATRSSCYTCHPGNDTKCMRGAMGSAIGPDGRFSMSCQSCHGSMSAVGRTGRVGWFDEPSCQNCHSGTATTNNGQIRYTTVFDNGQPRVPASTAFATTPNVPRPGSSLYRFSTGHGGLQCSACHGPPHAIYPSAVDNDNTQSVATVGHIGTIGDCRACHGKIEDRDLMRGPHGMHPVTNEWADDKHGGRAKTLGIATCRACHGAEDRGTVLSLAQGDRIYQTEFGTKRFFRGAKIGCYDCHNGPFDDDRINNAAPAVASFARATPNDVPLPIPLSATDANNDPLQIRLIAQPKHGTVGFQGNVATYYPEAGYTGPDAFTYAASDGKTDSNLGTVSMTVQAASCAGTVEPFGFGCPGSGGVMPRLRVSGCPTPGGQVRITIDRGLGGAVAQLLLGSARTALEVVPGCTLRTAPILGVSPPLPLSAGAPGTGGYAFDVSLPSTVVRGTRVVLQAYVVDPGGVGGVAATNGVEVVIR